MCLALPARVLERLADHQGVVDLNGVRKPISLALVPDVQAGDYVIVHVGFAIGRIDPQEAQRTLRMVAELGVPGTSASTEPSAPIGETPA